MDCFVSFYLLKYLYLTPQVFSPHPTAEAGSEWAAVVVLSCLGLTHNSMLLLSLRAWFRALKLDPLGSSSDMSGLAGVWNDLYCSEPRWLNHMSKLSRLTLVSLLPITPNMLLVLLCSVYYALLSSVFHIVLSLSFLNAEKINSQSAAIWWLQCTWVSNNCVALVIS